MTSPNISIEDVPINRFHQLLTLRSGGGSFVDGYVLSIIGVAMVQMAAGLNLTSFWQGMIAASALIGIFFGGFFGGWLTDRFGRKRVFFVGPTLFILASLAQLWVESALTLFLLRFAIVSRWASNTRWRPRCWWSSCPGRTAARAWPP